MKRLLIPLLLLLAFPLAAEIPVPYLGSHINDTADMLGDAAENDLDAMLRAYEDSTGNQLVLLTIPTLDGEAIEEYALRVAETWKLGKKGVDNGALLLVVRDDRKLRIEVGYGLEASLTDATTSYILNTIITPRFKNGDFELGIQDGLTAMMQASDGTLDTSSNSAGGFDVGLGMFMLFWFSIVGLFTVMGAFTPGCMGWFLYAFLIPFYAAPAFILQSETDSPIGLVLFIAYLIGYPVIRIFLPKTAFGKKMAEKMKKSQSSRGGSWSSGGWSSGGSSSGGFSSGGFSGGGGSFGGGGSSGSW